MEILANKLQILGNQNVKSFLLCLALSFQLKTAKRLLKSIYQRKPPAEAGEKPTGSANLNLNLRGRASAGAEEEVRAAEAGKAEQIPVQQPLRQETINHDVMCASAFCVEEGVILKSVLRKFFRSVIITLETS